MLCTEELSMLVLCVINTEGGKSLISQLIGKEHFQILIYERFILSHRLTQIKRPCWLKGSSADINILSMMTDGQVLCEDSE